MNDLELYFRFRCEKGLSKRGLASNQKYCDQLKYEIGIISQMGFCGYFLIVSDMITWCLKNNVPVGPGRGSVVGALVSYVLEITHLDPLKYNLIFERFLNPERVSMPDADIDISKTHRHLLLEYLSKKYGTDHVAHIGTFGSMKAKASVRDTARVLGYSYELGDELARLILPPIEGKDQSLEVCFEKVPELKNIRTGKTGTQEQQKTLIWAESFEGRVKSFSTHASGILISDRPVNEYVPLYPGKDDAATTQFDMHDVEEIGLIKFDLLGLDALTTIQTCIDLIKERHGVIVDPLKLDVDDQATYENLQQGNVVGVFQLCASSGIRDLTIKIQPKCLDDLSSILAIYRPGPLASPELQNFLSVRRGETTPNYLFPELEPILFRTDGFLIYQEQAMQIAQQIAGYTLGQADLLRRAMGKKKPEEMAKQKQIFIDGVISKGFREEDGKQLFEYIESFASYGFNRCIDGDEYFLRSTTSKNHRNFSIGELYKIRNDLSFSKLCKATSLRSKLQREGYGKAWSLNKEGKLVLNKIKDIRYIGKRDVYKITLSSGKTISVTSNHSFPTQEGKKKVTDLKVEQDSLYVSSGWKSKQAEIPTYLEKIVGIQLLDEQKDVYDVEMESPFHTFAIQNGIVTSNSHSIAYAYISYIMAWLKTHYAVEFITACMISDQDDQDKIIQYISESQRLGISILPPSVNESSDTFTISSDGKSIRFGLSAIKNLGKPTQLIVRERKKGNFQSFFDFLRRVNLSVINRIKVESLIFAGAFDDIESNRATLLNGVDKWWKYQDELEKYNSKQETYNKKLITFQQRQREIEEYSLLSKEERKGKKKPSQITCPIQPEAPIVPTLDSNLSLSQIEYLQHEKELLGFYISGHPLDFVYEKSKGSIAQLKDPDTRSRKIEIIAIPSIIKEKTTKKTKQKMASVVLEDKTGMIEAVIFSRTYSQFKGLISKQTPARYEIALKTDYNDDKQQDTNQAIITRIEAIQGSSNFERQQFIIKTSMEKALVLSEFLTTEKADSLGLKENSFDLQINHHNHYWLLKNIKTKFSQQEINKVIATG